MEDPKRMRTRLRLDLADVRKQIEDLEELLEEEKTEENLEAHRKLVQYEKKLKDEYEKVTGMTLDEANKLEDKDKIAAKPRRDVSRVSSSMGLISGLLIAYGFYNMVLHSLSQFTPTTLIEYFQGTTSSTADLSAWYTSMFYNSNELIIAVPFIVGSLAYLIGSLIDKSRNIWVRLFDGLAPAILISIFTYTLLMFSDGSSAADFIESNILLVGGTVLLAGFFMLFASFGYPSTSIMFLNIITSFLVIYSALQILLLSITPDEITTQFVWQFPWISLPLVFAGVLYLLTHLIRFLKK